MAPCNPLGERYLVRKTEDSDGMARRDLELIAKIERDVLDDSKSLAGVLRACMVLGGRVGSKDLREWASLQLNGYGDDMPLPDYRILAAPILIDGATIRGYGEGQRISVYDLPDVVAEVVKEEVHLSQGIGAIEALAAQAEAQKGFIRLSLPGAPEVVIMMNQRMDRFQRVTAVYWQVSGAALRAVLDRVRSALAELLGELVAGLADARPLSAELANQAMNVAVNGSKARVTVTNAQAATGGTATAGGTAEAKPSGFWTTSRKIGAFIVGVATIVAAIAAVLTIPH